MVSHSNAADVVSPDDLQRVQDLWFADGNLILQAENSIFRIYSGLLAARSSVFHDMFAFPPPQEGNASMDGCPIVFLYDSAQDLTFFLKAILDSAFFEPPPSPTELPIVEGVLRLSLKYDVQFLRRRAIQHLLTTFPITLPSWKTRDRHRTIPPVDNTPFAALRIAREFDLTFLLPAIFYCISSHPIEKTLDGAEWLSKPINISWADKRTCLIGRSKLLLSQSKNAIGMIKTADSHSDHCTGDSCPLTRLRCADLLSGWGVAGYLDYFEDNAEVYAPNLCEHCRAQFQEQCSTASDAMWNELTEMFELPNWDNLEKQVRLALE